MYVTANKVINTENVAMVAQQRRATYVATNNTKHTQSSCTQPHNFCPIWTTGVSPDFRKKKVPQYQISRKSVRWEPEDIQTDAHEASGRLGSAGNPSDRSRQDKTT